MGLMAGAGWVPISASCLVASPSGSPPSSIWHHSPLIFIVDVVVKKVGVVALFIHSDLKERVEKKNELDKPVCIKIDEITPLDS